MLSVHSKSVLYNDGVKVACVAYLLTARADFKQLQVFLWRSFCRNTPTDTTPVPVRFSSLQNSVAPLSTTLVFPRVRQRGPDSAQHRKNQQLQFIDEVSQIQSQILVSTQRQTQWSHRDSCLDTEADSSDANAFRNTTDKLVHVTVIVQTSYSS